MLIQTIRMTTRLMMVAFLVSFHESFAPAFLQFNSLRFQIKSRTLSTLFNQSFHQVLNQTSTVQSKPTGLLALLVSCAVHNQSTRTPTNCWLVVTMILTIPVSKSAQAESFFPLSLACQPQLQLTVWSVSTAVATCTLPPTLTDAATLPSTIPTTKCVLVARSNHVQRLNKLHCHWDQSTLSVPATVSFFPPKQHSHGDAVDNNCTTTTAKTAPLVTSTHHAAWATPPRCQRVSSWSSALVNATGSNQATLDP